MEIENRYKLALERFFSENPRILAELESTDPAEIEALGVSVEEYQLQRRSVFFAQAAERLGLDVDEFVIRLVADSPEQAHLWRLDRNRQTASALGIEWEEYKQLNRINE